VRHRKELGHFSAAPNCQHFLSDDRLGLTSLATGLLIFRNDLVLELSSYALKNTLQTTGFQAVGSYSDQIDLVLLKKLGKLLFVLLVLLLLVGLWLGATVVRLAIAILISSLAWRQKSHEITCLHKLTILVYNAHCDDIVVGINLVHDGAHDVVSLAVLDDLVVLLAASFLGLLLMIHVVVVACLGGEGSSHEKFAVDFLGFGNDKGLSLLLDLLTNLLDELFDQQLLNQEFNDLCTKNVPLIGRALRILHVEAHQEVLEIRLFGLVDGDVDIDQTGFLALQDIQVEVVLVA
jgi:hypothetical protein